MLTVVSAPALGQRATDRERDRERAADRREDCDRNRGDRGVTFCDEREVGWRANRQTIAVDAGPNGGVEVVGWDRDSVSVSVLLHARASTLAAARELAGQVTVSVQNGVLRAEGPASRRSASWWVSYEIRAPRNSDLTLETENGPVSVEDVTGRMDLRAINGPITLDNVGGAVRARLDNGPLTIALTGTQWTGQGLDAETRNGPVMLRIPENYNAELETGTINGPMDIGFPVTVQGRFGGGRQRLTTTLGRGGPSVRAVTTNGPAVISRSRR